MNKLTTSALALILALACPAGMSAQDDAEEKKKEVKKDESGNLVENGSFEVYEGSLRRKEQFELATGWINPTESKSELYASEVKSRYIAIPENMYGMEDPAEGMNYAGFVNWSPRGKMPRSYVQATFKEAMKEKGLYCVKFKASLAERSRHASNNIGVSIDKSALSNKSMMSLDASAPIFSGYNDVVDTREGWWEFCTLYRATGKEKYITIGNFWPDDRTKNILMDLPAKYTEEGPIPAAYFYIDDVQVIPIATDGNCNCASDRIPESKIIFSGSVQLNDEMTLAEKVQALDVYFYQYQAEVVSASERDINLIIDLLVDNPEAILTIIGHSDNEEAKLAESEATLKSLAMKRANQVKSYMVDQGIDETRIVTKSMDNTAPVAKMATPVSLAKNRRVEFEVK